MRGSQRKVLKVDSTPKLSSFKAIYVRGRAHKSVNLEENSLLLGQCVKHLRIQNQKSLPCPKKACVQMKKTEK